MKGPVGKQVVTVGKQCGSGGKHLVLEIRDRVGSSPFRCTLALCTPPRRTLSQICSPYSVNWGGLENVRIGKCQNPFFAHFERNWKVSELESVKVGKCQNAFFFKIGKCQNRKVSELESVRIFRFFKYGANGAWVTIVIQITSLETSICTWHKHKLQLKHYLAHI